MFERFGTAQANDEHHLQQDLLACRAALREIGACVGVAVEDNKPEEAAVAICAAIGRSSSGVRFDPIEAGEEERPVHSGIKQLSVSGSASVTVMSGAVPRLTIRCSDKSYLPKITTEVSGNTLKISQEPVTIVVGDSRNNIRIGGADGTVVYTGDAIIGTKVEATLVLPSLSDLTLSGAAAVTYEDVAVDELHADVAGGGKLRLAGKVGHFEADVSGAGSVRAFDLAAANASLHVSGAGEIRATVSKSVKARVSGAGKVKLAGDPYPRDTKVSGAGKIKFVDRSECATAV